MSEFERIGEDPKVLNFLKDIQSLQERIPPGDDEDECPDCDGYGYIVTEDTVRMCHCLAERKILRAVEKAGIPRKYQKKTLDNFKTDIDSRGLALRQVRRFLENFGKDPDRPGLFLFGAAGTGKTHLAVGALKELIRSGKSGLFYDMVNLIMDFRSEAAGNLSAEQEERLQRLTEVDVLVLDNLGAGRLSEFILEKTYALIDKRYSNNRCIIATSNLGMSDLEKQISYPVFSRIRGMCLTVPTGELDYRNPELRPAPIKKTPGFGKKPKS